MSEHAVDAEPGMFHFSVPEAKATVTRGKPPKPPWYKRIKNVADWLRLAHWIAERAMEVYGFLNRVVVNRESKLVDA